MARKKRQLTPEENHLWQRLTKTVRPIDPRQSAGADGDLVPGPAEQPEAKTTSTKTTSARQHTRPRKSMVQRSVVGSTPSPVPRPQPVSEAGDPRQAKRVSRGRRQIDATLDLHGLTQEQAYVTLSRFLDQARMMGYATVLVITGKGAPEDMDQSSFSVSRGILRRRFLDWTDGPFRAHISSIRQSHQKHGGAGAFYVFLKRQS